MILDGCLTWRRRSIHRWIVYDNVYDISLDKFEHIGLTQKDRPYSKRAVETSENVKLDHSYVARIWHFNCQQRLLTTQTPSSTWLPQLTTNPRPAIPGSSMARHGESMLECRPRTWSRGVYSGNSRTPCAARAKQNVVSGDGRPFWTATDRQAVSWWAHCDPAAEFDTTVPINVLIRDAKTELIATDKCKAAAHHAEIVSSAC